MKKTNILTCIVLMLSVVTAMAQRNARFMAKSPDGKIELTVTSSPNLSWSVKHQNDVMIAPSEMTMTLATGEVLGKDVQILSSANVPMKESIQTSLYKKKIINNEYRQLTILCKSNWGVVFRVYNDGVAYRFFTKRKGDMTVVSEESNFNFNADYPCFIPYVCDLRDPKDQYVSAFEALYDKITISQFKADSLSLVPLLVNVGKGKKVAVLEADLQDYPGMFLTVNKTTKTGFQSRFANYPTEEKIGGFANLNMMPVKRAGYIAKVSGTRSFPWRVAIISENDKELLNNDMVYKLSTPSQIKDMSWIKPGKVAWDWWNNWNISGVDFKAGVNTQTYKYYIDFASKNGIEYIVLDEGWSVSATNMMEISNNIDLKELIAYGKQKHVDLILWASWRAIYAHLDAALEKYAAMGIKGFKIDFVDRDDQIMVRACTEIARKAADKKLVIDYHGMFKPAGLQTTYPNVLNFEGVRGLENCKWHNYDAATYEATMPFIRMLAGPADYTPGAMRNANKSCYRPVNDNPMSQGTRCHQLAMYVAFEAPLQMLADNPTAYMKDQECTSFISKIPTVFDETIALDGRVGEFLSLARRKGDVWYVGALTQWNAREIEIDFSFLGKGQFQAEIMKDGVNADRQATDYKKEIVTVNAQSKLKFQLAPGGGLAIVIGK